MNKLLKSHDVALPQIKNQKGRKFHETCRVRICICKESKNRKLMMRKVATSRKNKTH